MPIYKVRRSRTEIVHQAISEDVYVEADSSEQAKERAENGEVGLLGFFDSGNTEYTGETVSPDQVKSVEETGAESLQEIAKDESIFTR